MLSQRICSLRKSKGYSQEELASKLNVVRQTVSKWEKNRSVPDADMLIKPAEVLDVSVSDLLGSGCAVKDENENGIPIYLERINEQLAIQNRRKGRIIKVPVGVAIAAFLLTLLHLIFGPATHVNIDTWTEQMPFSET